MSVVERKTVVVSPESPWVGLDPFTEGVREYFFGRDGEVLDLFQRVVHKPLTVLFSRSGLGKTSLLQAALVPRLRDAGFLPIVLRLDHADGAAPLLQQFVDALACALAPAKPGVDVPFSRLADQASSLWLLFHDPIFGFTSPDGPRPVVVLDQFEEIFTRGQATSDRQSAAAEFLEMLADLVENRVPESLRARLETDDKLADRLEYAVRPAKVLISLREDFVHTLERFRSRMPTLMDNRFELRLLSGRQALEAIVEPGRLRCRRRSELPPLVSEETGAAIVRFIANVGQDVPLAEIDAVPPLLSLLCAELNQQRLAAGESMIRSEQLKGRAEDILEQFYERCFASQPPAVRTFVEERLLSADGYFRESTSLDTTTHELVQAGLTVPAAVDAINRLLDARLLTSEERGGVRRIELTHDILAPIARRSRDLRRKAENAAQRRRRRNQLIGLAVCLALLVAGISVPLAVWALREREGARAQEKSAIASKNLAVDRSQAAEAANRNLEIKNHELESLLQEKAHSDRIFAKEELQRREYGEALAYLARARRYAPKSSFAEEAAIPALLSSPIVRSQVIFNCPDKVSSAVFSPDGQYVLTAGDKTARLWGANSGKLIVAFQGHSKPVVSAVFSPDGQRVLTASADKTARVWEANSGKLLAVLKGHTKDVNLAVFSPDGERVLTASADKTAWMWEATSGRLLAIFQGHTDAIISAVFSSDGRRVLTASADKTARVWEAGSGRLLATLQGHALAVNSAVFSSNGQRVLTASADKTARLWDASSGKPLASFEGHSDNVFSAVFSPDGQLVLTASADTTARLWEASSGKSLYTFTGHTGAVQTALFSPDGLFVLTASWDSTVRLWEAKGGEVLATLQGHSGVVSSAVFSPDGRCVLTAGDKTARLWKAACDKLPPAFSSPDAVNYAVFSPDGQRVLVASSSGKTVRIWEAESGKFLVTFRTDQVDSAIFSPDGRYVLTAGDKTVRFWEANNGRLLGTFRGHTDAINSAVFSPDGQRVLTASSDRTARLWEANSGKLLAALQGHTDAVNSAVFSPGGQWVLTASEDNTARLWDANSGKLLTILLGHTDRISRAVFSPDGQRILTASDDDTARLWESQSGNLLATFQGHAGAVKSAVFSPDGQSVLTASDDGTARLWESQSGKLLAIFQVDTSAVKSAVFSPDGQRVLTVSNDARLWQANSGELLAIFGENGVDNAVFSPDGRHVLTTSSLALWLWPILPCDTPSPDWWSDFLVWFGGERIAQNGEIEVLSENELVKLRDQLRPHMFEDSDYARLLRWRFLPLEERSVDPYGTTTQEQAADLVIRSGMDSGDVRHAHDLDPTHPLLHLALAGLEDDSVRADFLRRYSLDRLPQGDTELTQRAGDLLLYQGKLSEALEAYQRTLGIVKHRADKDESDTRCQLDLSVSYEKIGDALEAQSKLAEALESYQQSLRITQRLAEQDKSNTVWQRDLAQCYEKVGLVFFGQSLLDKALQAFRRKLELLQTLVSQDKSNGQWQSELAVTFRQLGAVSSAQGNLDITPDGAIAQYTQSIRLDPYSSDAYFGRAMIKQVLADFPGALSDYLHGIELVPAPEPQSDPDYAYLFVWLVRAQEGQVGVANDELSAYLNVRGEMSNGDWVFKIGSFLLNKISEADFLAVANGTDRGQRCEAWYYAAMKRLLAGDKETAARYLKNCLATQQTRHDEYNLARAELNMLIKTK